MTAAPSALIRDYGDSNIACLQASVSGLAGNAPVSLDVTLPTGFGDCKLLNVGFQAGALTGFAANFGIYKGPVVHIRDVAGGQFEVWGTALWVSRSATTFGASIDRDMAALVRQTDIIRVEYDVVDTGAGTHTMNTFLVVQRLRNLGAP